MKVLVLIISLLTLASSASAESFRDYFNTRTGASTPPGIDDYLLLYQGGIVKKIRSSDIMATGGVSAFNGRSGAVSPTTGDYSASQITGLAAVATTGSYNSLTSLPNFAAIATTGAWADITGKPSFATVATTGSWNDLLNQPTIPSALSQLTDDSTHRVTTDAEKTAWNGVVTNGLNIAQRQYSSHYIKMLQPSTNGSYGGKISVADTITADHTLLITDSGLTFDGNAIGSSAGSGLYGGSNAIISTNNNYSLDFRGKTLISRYKGTITWANISSGRQAIFNNSTGVVKLKPASATHRFIFGVYTAAPGCSVTVSSKGWLEAVTYNSDLFTALMTTATITKTGIFEYGGGGGSCTRVTIQQQEATASGNIPWNGATSSNYYATQLVYSGTTGTACSLDVNIAKVAAPTGNIAAAILNDSGTDTPGAVLTTCGTMDVATLGTSLEWKTFSCSDATLTNGTKYWVRLYHPSADDGINKLMWGYASNAVTKRYAYSTDGTTYSGYQTAEGLNFKLYIKE